MVTLALHLLFALNSAWAAEPDDREPLWGTLEITEDIVGIAYGDPKRVPDKKCAASFQVRPAVGSNSVVYSVTQRVLTADTSGSELYTIPQGLVTAVLPDYTPHDGGYVFFKSWAYAPDGAELIDMFYILLHEGALELDITVSGVRLPRVKVENPKETQSTRWHRCTITYL
jgi:hypothetical protein